MPDTRFVSRRRHHARVYLDGAPGGLWADVTAQGLSLSLHPVSQVGTPVKGELQVGERSFPFQGEVTWAHLGDPRLSFVGRMGIRFTDIPDEFFPALGDA